ncbi:helix-turn-helix transcriptional regulator [Corynebacterium lubricantis]|uniref:helix-turn-helix transcriptional regulator n=1 Tax=Corynebacterium lubricantis TaxID=541095 RepID=UPI00037AE30B|nr:LuxR family transcriptional regulator [Corynebacterium lubricantis]
MAYSAATDTQRVVEQIVGSPAGTGTIIILAGPGPSEVVDRVVRTLPGFAIARISAMEWRSEDQGWLSCQLQRDLGDFKELDSAKSAQAIVVDNAQWADKSSLHELIELAQTTKEGRFALVLATTSNTTVEQYRYLADLTITLPPLGIDDVAALSLRHRGVHLNPDLSNRVLEVTGGDPGLIRDLLDAVPEDHWHQSNPYLPLPAHWRRAFDERTKDIDVIEALQTVSACSDLDALEELIDDKLQLTTAFAHGIVHSVPDGTRRVVVFANSTDLAVIRASTPPEELRSIHQRAATWFRVQGNETEALMHDAQGLEESSDELAEIMTKRSRQLSMAGNYRQAFTMLSFASKVAGDSSLSDKLTLRAIESLISDSDIPRARQYALQMRGQGNNAHVDSIRGYLALHEGRRFDAKSLIERAWATLEAHDSKDAEMRTRVASRQVLLSLCEWQPEKLVGWAATSSQWAEPQSSTNLEAHYISIIGKAATSGVAPDDAPVPWETEIMAQRRHMATGWVALVHDDLTAARQHLMVQSSGEGSERIGTWMDAWLARAYYLSGDLDAAERAMERGLARVERFGITFLEPLLLWTGSTIASMRGDRELTRMYTSRMTLSHDAFPIQQIPSAMARLHVAQTDADLTTALRFGQHLVDLDKEVDTSQPGFWPWHDVWVNTLVQAGRLDEAQWQIDRDLDRVQASNIISVKAKLNTSHGRLLLAQGEVTKGVQLFDDAMSMIEPLNTPIYTARILFEYGQALRRVGKRKLADDRFARAAELYATMGADFFVERCNRERRAGGLGSREPSPNGLTPQEMEIATLVADGATNKEAATELYLSAKTVEYHLTRVYRKLGIRTRSELSRALHNQ